MASRNILRELRSVNCMEIMESTTSQRTFLDNETDKENTMSILIATDNHIGYLEKDPERGEDSFTTFEEILQLAKENQVDFILLGGDLFHENKPSRKVVHKTMELLRKYCMGDSPCYLEFLSDQSINFASSSFPTVNYEDPNYNISTPVFSIHGNHDDPAGDGNLCTLNLFSVNGLVNYFGKASNVDDITVNPILIQKGSTKLALYGLGSIRDERLHRTFINKKVKMLRPKEDADSWFNCFVLHQNRTKHGPKNYIPEQFLDEFLDLVIWGHEHECLIDPQWTDSEKDFYISQPGSSVATSLCAAEAKPKHVGILKIQEKQFRMDKILLKTVRPFYTKDVILSETDVDPTDDEAIQEYLTEQVEELIQKSNLEHTGHRKQPKQPIIRIRVEYSGGFSPFNVNRFGQRFVKRVANTKDILLFFRKKVFEKKGGRGTGDGGTARIHPEILDDTSMEDLIMGYLNSEDENQKLRLLSGHKMGLALHEFVDKSETEAIGEIVKLQLRDTQNKMKKRDTVKEGNIIEEIIKETERSRTEELTQEERVRTREDLQEAVNESRNKKPEEESVVIDGSDEESENQIGQTSRGRGKGRGRGRGKGTRTTTKTRDTSWITTTSRTSSRSKQNASIVIEDDFATVETFNGKNTSQSARNQSSTMSRSKRYDNSEMDEEEDPFAFPSKRQRK